jgi:DNA-binding CsgD family transcriptional regulator
VLALRAHGKTYKEIAPELGITINTVNFHVRNILRKTGSHSSAEATFKLRESAIAA